MSFTAKEMSAMVTRGPICHNRDVINRMDSDSTR
jgi:hypothetical protein